VNQRRSFRAHIINGFRNALPPYRATQGYQSAGNIDVSQDPVDANLDSSEIAHGLKEADIEVGVNNNKAKQKAQGDQVDDNDNGIPDSEEKFIEVEPDKMPTKADEKDEEKETFSIPGEDSTGRNVALLTFKKIEKAITDDYSLLDSKQDREIFYEYGIINLKLYFDRWEEELQTNIREK
jgi:hypothetical protein